MTSIAGAVHVLQQTPVVKPIVKAKGALFKVETVDKGRLASRNNSTRMPASRAETSKQSQSKDGPVSSCKATGRHQVHKNDTSHWHNHRELNLPTKHQRSTASCAVYLNHRPGRLLHLYMASTTTVKHSMLHIASVYGLNNHSKAQYASKAKRMVV